MTSSNNLHHLSASEAGRLLTAGEISAIELTEAVLSRIEAVEPQVRGLVTVTAEQARQAAQEADKRIREGNATPLTGVPLVLKDNMCTAGISTTCSSRMLEGFVPPYTATAAQKLLDAGAVLVGKSNMDEFAMGSSTENSAFFPTHNPWDSGRVPGGSSGGSAATVAAGETLIALGSDTGGSIRQPASFCGVVGIKPTYGTVSRYGLIAFASSLDQIGPLASNVTDAALTLNAISGYDAMDSTSINRESPDYSRALVPDVRGMKIGVVKEMFGEGVEPQVRDTVLEAARVLEQAGAIVDWEVSLSLTEYALPVYYILAPSEASSNLARYDGVKYGYSWDGAADMWEGMERTRQHGFGPEVKRRILLGAYALSSGYYDAYYRKAQQVRTLIRREYEDAFTRFDVLLTPTSPTLPFGLGERTNDPLAMYLADICTIPVNIAGVPAISLPCGFVDGLPVGLQLIGPSLGEETIIRAAYTYEQATDWHGMRPELG
ncbi:MAG: Asp-tRNA(Asn)/Glu-tRNA(Gln) amidotransferase subunit GatA [Chloroflexi bacterium]|nr:Asp-tRNA(Asn)/Glu-tRNA(Gln) amidotransferase subunit GatA [Chloroflexota bacterium]